MVTVGFSFIFIGVIIVAAIVELIAFLLAKKNDYSSDSGNIIYRYRIQYHEIAELIFPKIKITMRI